MAFSPFDGVLLDDAREPIPGAFAVGLHLRVERDLAGADRRIRLDRQAILDRGTACQDLLRQGLLPSQLRGLSDHGLRLGKPSDPRSLAALIRHLETYLLAVDEAGFIEPFEALWKAANAHESGGRGFWVERTVEDGPLPAFIEDLAPPRLRALAALKELGTVRFHLAAERGSGVRNLFDRRAPHLVDQLLPNLESIAAGVEHFEIETPKGWAENPWGAALDGLFGGALGLAPEVKSIFRRGLLPSPFAVLRGAVEQVRAWVDAGVAQEDIALIHPEAENLGPLLEVMLAAEGLGLARVEGRTLDRARPWASLLAIFEGLRDEDPQRLATGLLGIGEADWAALADELHTADQGGAAALERPQARPRISKTWAQLVAGRSYQQSPGAWAAMLKSQTRSLGLVQGAEGFYGAMGLLEEAWAREGGIWNLAQMIEALTCFLEVGTEAPRLGKGMALLSPAALQRGWAGARATLLLDLGEGAWPAQSHPPPDLDWERRAAINAALRSAPQRADFPSALQTFQLPRAEEGEALPRSLHRDAFGFNLALALTREGLVALSSTTGSDGKGRAQGPFWKALEGAGEWAPDPSRSHSHFRHAWDGAVPSVLESERQQSMRVQDPAEYPALHSDGPEMDRVEGWWREGQDEEHPISPTRLEALARCPFRVFGEKGLGLSSWKAGPSTALFVGTSAHKLMQLMLEDLGEAEDWPSAFLARNGLVRPTAWALNGLFMDRWNGTKEAILAESKAATPEERQRVSLAVEGLLPNLAESLAWDLAQASPSKTELEKLGLEVAGGWKRRLLGLELGIAAQNVGEDLGLDSPLWMRGQVDRLERWECGGQVFLRVVDYKTSSQSDLDRYDQNGGLWGPHLQLPLYQWLVERSYSLPVSAVLWSLKDFSKPIPAMFGTAELEKRAKLHEHLKLLLQRARQGRFPAVPGAHCATCSLGAVCGRPVDVEALKEDVEEEEA